MKQDSIIKSLDSEEAEGENSPAEYNLSDKGGSPPPAAFKNNSQFANDDIQVPRFESIKNATVPAKKEPMFQLKLIPSLGFDTPVQSSISSTPVHQGEMTQMSRRTVIVDE